jgi:hypothetical protein
MLISQAQPKLSYSRAMSMFRWSEREAKLSDYQIHSCLRNFYEG